MIKVDLEAIETAVIEDITAIIEGKGKGETAVQCAKRHFPGDTPEALISQLIYCEVAKALGPEAIKLILKRATLERFDDAAKKLTDEALAKARASARKPKAA